MPYPKESPYDLFEVSPNASGKELLDGYARALSKHRNRAREVQAYRQQLNTPAGRLAFDILLTALGGEGDLAAFVSRYEQWAGPPVVAEPLPLGTALIVLDDFRRDFRALAFRAMRLPIVAEHSHPEGETLPVTFDG